MSQLELEPSDAMVNLKYLLSLVAQIPNAHYSRNGRHLEVSVTPGPYGCPTPVSHALQVLCPYLLS